MGRMQRICNRAGRPLGGADACVSRPTQPRSGRLSRRAMSPPARFALLFAAQFPAEWGRTRKREIHCGHRHHRDEKEYNGAVVIQHPTLAARDAYAARGGWIADRAAQAITYHRKYGQVGRVSVCPEMLEAA